MPAYQETLLLTASAGVAERCFCTPTPTWTQRALALRTQTQVGRRHEARVGSTKCRGRFVLSLTAVDTSSGAKSTSVHFTAAVAVAWHGGGSGPQRWLKATPLPSFERTWLLGFLLLIFETWKGLCWLFNLRFTWWGRFVLTAAAPVTTGLWRHFYSSVSPRHMNSVTKHHVVTARLSTAKGWAVACTRTVSRYYLSTTINQ